MPHTRIVIRHADDKTPAFPEIVNDNFVGEGELYGVSILENGMLS